MMITWFWKPFGALSSTELYDIMRARQQVFIIEQTCFYSDLDGADLYSWHLIGHTLEIGLAAYLRVLMPGAQRPEPAIGRVLTVASMRGKGLGRQLIAEGLKRAQQQFPGQDIVLSAQCHLVALYQEFGFQSVGEPYVEDGIPHVDMRIKS